MSLSAGLAVLLLLILESHSVLRGCWRIGSEVDWQGLKSAALDILRASGSRRVAGYGEACRRCASCGVLLEILHAGEVAALQYISPCRSA